MPANFPRRLVLVLFCVSLLGGDFSSPALASGGGSIAAAPTAAYGQQQFGNTVTDTTPPLRSNCLTGDSWWTLGVTAGDRLTIDYEGGVDYLNVWPVGTTDFNLSSASIFNQSHMGGNDKQEVVFVAPRSGGLPLEFLTTVSDPSCFGNQYTQPGPYDFTAYVQHGLRLALPRVSKLRRTGTLRIGVHTPEGGAISDPALLVDLQIQRGRHWLTVGRAAVVNSVAVVSFKLSSRLVRSKLGLRAIAHGGAYQQTTSQTRRVLIAPTPPKHRAPRHLVAAVSAARSRHVTVGGEIVTHH